MGLAVLYRIDNCRFVIYFTDILLEELYFLNVSVADEFLA
jgi:hypothetical protein